MNYGHAERLAAITAGKTPAAADAHPVDPRLYDDPDLRAILAERDIAGLYRSLKAAGLSYRCIAELTGQSQSEICDILNGRKVTAYDVLVRIAERLSIPRGRMGLSYSDGGAYPCGVTAISPEEIAALIRRHVLALAPIATLARNPIIKLTEMMSGVELPAPSPVPLPSRIGWTHVQKVRDMTRRLAESRRIYGSDPELNSEAADQATRLLSVPGTDDVEKALKSAVAQLHLQAGWSGFDSGLYDRAMYHYARAMELGIKASDSYCQALALGWAGLATIEHVDPNEGLKILQLGLIKVLDVPSELDPNTVVFGERSRNALHASMLTDAATAYHRLDGYPDVAREADAHLA